MIHEVLPVGPLQCNCSLLGDEASGEAIVVDPGDEVQRILNLANKHHLSIKQIIITHAHIDHIAGAHRLKQLTGAPILYNQRDLPLVKMMDMQAAWLGMQTPEVMPPDEDLTDGRIIAVGIHPSQASAASDSPSPMVPTLPDPPRPQPGLTGQVLLTPGHTPGSLCVYLRDQNLLLAGDTLFAGSIGRTDLPGGDHNTLLRSIRAKIFPLPDETVVLPGHGPRTTVGEERATNPFLT